MQTPYAQNAGGGPRSANVSPSEARSLAWLKQIPTTATCKVPKPDKPSPMAFVRLTMTLLFMLFVGWAAYLIGMWPITIVFVIACIAGFFGAHNVGVRYMREAFAHYDESPTADAEDTVDLGLLNENDPTMAMLMAPLSKGLKARIGKARAAEADSTAAWLDSTEGFHTAQTTSSDGTPLVAHVYSQNSADNRWVIFAHDYHGSWKDGLLYARHYAQQGYNLLLVEMRGHGASGGAWIGMGYLDSLDLLAWCNWIVQEAGNSAKVVLHGSSMGAAAALLCAGESALPSQVKAAVCENAFTDAWNAIVSLYHGLGMDVHPALDLVRSNLRRQKGGYDLSLASPIEYLDDVNLPILFMHAAHDTLVPPYMSVQMYRAANEKHPEVEHGIASFDHAGHEMSCLGDAEEFYGKLFGFLQTYL